MRKKGSLINWTNIQRNSGLEVAFVQVSGVNLDAETLKGLDIRGIDWVGLPGGKTALLDKATNYIQLLYLYPSRHDALALGTLQKCRRINTPRSRPLPFNRAYLPVK